MHAAAASPTPAPGSRQLALLPAAAAASDPLQDLCFLPPRDHFQPALHALYDVHAESRTRELNLGSCRDYTQAGENVRATLPGLGDAALILDCQNLAERFQEVGSAFDLKTILTSIRPDLLTTGARILRGFDKLDDTVRDQVRLCKLRGTDRDLRGVNFTHTEVKQSAKAFEIMAEPELRAQEENNAWSELMVFKRQKEREASASEERVAELEGVLARAQSELDAERRKRDALVAAKNGLLVGARQIRTLGHPVTHSRLKRARETTFGMLTEPILKASKKQAGKTCSGTQRDKGILLAMGIEPDTLASELRFDQVAHGFLSLAQGNAQAQAFAAANTFAAQSPEQLLAIGVHSIAALEAQIVQIKAIQAAATDEQ